MIEKKSTQRLVGTTISWVRIFIQVIVSLFFIPFFLSSVGDKQYGLYSFSTSIIVWIDTLMIAVGSAYYKFLSREKKERGEEGEALACGVFFKIFFVIAILVLVFGAAFDLLLYFNVIHLNEYSIAEKNQICLIVLMSVISTSLSSFFTTHKSYCYYKEKYIFVYILAIIQIAIQTGLSVLLLKLGYGVVYIALVHFASGLLVTICMVIFSKFVLKQKYQIVLKSEQDKTRNKKLIKEIVVFSSFVIINTVVDMLNKSLDKIILGFYNADLVATYQLAYTIPTYLISFTSIICVVYTQKMNDVYYNGGGLEGMNKVFLRGSKFQTVVALLLVGGFVACGKEFIFLWLDYSRITVYYVAVVLMLLYSLTCSNELAIIARRTQDKHIKASIVYLCIAVANVGISLLLVNLMTREDAIWACVIGTIITYVIGHFVIMQIYDQKVTKIDIKKFFFNYLMYFAYSMMLAVLMIRFFDLFLIGNTLLRFVVKVVTYSLLYLTFVLLYDKDIKTILFDFFKKRMVKPKTQEIVVKNEKD